MRLFIAITPVIVSLITYSIIFLLFWHVIYLHESKSEDTDRFPNPVGSRGKKEEEHTQPRERDYVTIYEIPEGEAKIRKHHSMT